MDLRVLVISDKMNYPKIEKYIESYKLFFCIPEEISFISGDKKLDSPSGFDRIIIDIYNTEAAVKLYEKSSDFDKLYLWFCGALICVAEPELLNTIQEKAFQKKEWGLVKQINMIKINLNRIMRKAVLDTYPSQLQIESTSFCNAQCIMCTHYYMGNDGAIDMSQEILKKLSELMPYLQIIIMHGNGEPFSSRLFNESVDLYSSYEIGLTTNTNLSILTDKHIERINRSFVNIRVSCDACTKEIYEGIRKNLSFERFVLNCAKLRDMCPKVEKTMASVMMRQNIEQLPDMVRFAAEYGFREIIFSNLGTSLIVENQDDNISKYPYLAAKMLRNAIEAGKECGIIVTIPSSFDLSLNDEEMCISELEAIHSFPFFKTDEQVIGIRKYAESIVGNECRIVENMADCLWEDNLYDCKGICDWCLEKPYIDLKGDVFVCCINASYRIGNIFECDSFMDIWNNDTYKKIRELFYLGKLPGFCDNCQFILNGSLKRLYVPSPEKEFYNRRHISKFYHDYCEEHKYE